MISKNVKYGGMQGVTVVEFGKGTLIGAVGYSNTIPQKDIILKNSLSVGIVGAPVYPDVSPKHRETAEEFGVELVLRFENLEGVLNFKDWILKMEELFRNDEVSKSTEDDKLENI